MNELGARNAPVSDPRQWRAQSRPNEKPQKHETTCSLPINNSLGTFQTAGPLASLRKQQINKWLPTPPANLSPHWVAPLIRISEDPVRQQGARHPTGIPQNTEVLTAVGQSKHLGEDDGAPPSMADQPVPECAPEAGVLRRRPQASATTARPPQDGKQPYQICHHLLHVLGAFFHLILGPSELNNITLLCWVWKVDDNLEQSSQIQVQLLVRTRL